MEHVIFEQSFAEPIQVAEFRRRAEEGAWCFDLHRARHHFSLLSVDGLRSFCLFVAPDAEAVRDTLRQLAIPLVRTWTASIHDAPGVPDALAAAASAAAHVVVERSFDPPVELAAIQAIEDRGAWCLDQHRVRFLRTYFSTDRRRMLCCYAAPDAESVRLAQTQAGMPFDRVWSAQLYQPVV